MLQANQSGGVRSKQIGLPEVSAEDLHRFVAGVRRDEEFSEASVTRLGDESRSQRVPAVHLGVESDPCHAQSDSPSYRCAGDGMACVPAAIEPDKQWPWLGATLGKPVLQTKDGAGVAILSERHSYGTAAAFLILFLASYRNLQSLCGLGKIRGEQLGESAASQGAGEAEHQQSPVSKGLTPSLLSQFSADRVKVLNGQRPHLSGLFLLGPLSAADKCPDGRIYRGVEPVGAVGVSNAGSASDGGRNLATIGEQVSQVKRNSFGGCRQTFPPVRYAPALEHLPVLGIGGKGVCGALAFAKSRTFVVEVIKSAVGSYWKLKLSHSDNLPAVPKLHYTIGLSSMWATPTVYPKPPPAWPDASCCESKLGGEDKQREGHYITRREGSRKKSLE